MMLPMIFAKGNSKLLYQKAHVFKGKKCNKVDNCHVVAFDRTPRNNKKL